MSNITYVIPDGSSRVVAAVVGQTIMEAAVQNNVPGILADCGGTVSCATCHVHLEPEYRQLFDEPDEVERDMLEFTDGASGSSRLSCQLVVTSACDGVRVSIPKGNC